MKQQKQYEIEISNIQEEIKNYTTSTFGTIEQH